MSLRGVPWSVENPRSSWAWWLPSFTALLDQTNVEDVTFAHCVFGGDRPKVTLLRFAPKMLFNSLGRKYDNSHVHRPMGQSWRQVRYRA